MKDSESDNNMEDDRIQVTHGESEDEESLDEDENAEESLNSSYSDSWKENLTKISNLRDQQPQHKAKAAGADSCCRQASKGRTEPTACGFWKG